MSAFANFFGARRRNAGPRGETSGEAEKPRAQLEDRLLWGIFGVLLLGAAATLATDFLRLSDQAAASRLAPPYGWPPELVDPAAPSDHLRRYLPSAAPLRPGGAPPELPGVGAPDPTSLGQRMAFIRGPNGAASAIGRIEQGVGDDFAIFLENQNGEVTAIHLHSPGGSVPDALQLARLARDKGLDMIVPNDAYCASSCPIFLSGGVKRRVGGAAYVGVHQIFAVDESQGGLADGLSEAQSITATIQTRLAEHGVDPSLWIHAMQTPKTDLYLLTKEQLLQYALATEIIEP